MGRLVAAFPIKLFWALVKCDQTIVIIVMLTFLFVFLQLSHSQITFKPGPVNTTVTEYSDAHFYCKPEGRGNTSIGWAFIRDGNEEIFTNDSVITEMGIAYLSEDRTQFFLKNVTRYVNGMHVRCSGGDDEGSNQVLVTLTVEWPADYTGSTETVTGNILQPLEVSFNVSANPEQTGSMLNRVDGVPIDTEMISVMYNLVNFTYLRCADDGMYTITATNAAGNGSFNFTVTVNKAEPTLLGSEKLFFFSLYESINISDIISACPEFVFFLPINGIFTKTINICREKLNLTFNRSQLTKSKVAGEVTVNFTVSNSQGCKEFMVNIAYKDGSPSIQNACVFILMVFTMASMSLLLIQ